ncbi:amidohydrolase [Pseudomonas protegens]|uniref:amidohydrolase family protein n=1 Tax=Pseudomonas protegens TaxID=380021 RepID=UPI001C8D978F|nr:amidohydrolase family protein [Pseudomonas protegens]QZI71857.1 amidohydrolase [Pseudomonas protegens]
MQFGFPECPHLDGVVQLHRTLEILSLSIAESEQRLRSRAQECRHDVSIFSHRYLRWSAGLLPPAVAALHAHLWQDKVLFGSNFPQLSLKKCLEQVRTLELPPAIADKFLQGNARRVFGL